MSAERNWEEATEDDLQDGCDDGEEDALIEASRRDHVRWDIDRERLHNAKKLLRRWRHAAENAGTASSEESFASLVTATNSFFYEADGERRTKPRRDT